MATWNPADWGVFLASVAVLVGAIAAGAVTIINAMRGVSTKVDALEVKVDGRLSQLLAQTQYASRAEGVVAGRAETSVPEVVPAPTLAPTVKAPETSPDGTVVIGIPVPTPPMLLVPVEEEKPKE